MENKFFKLIRRRQPEWKCNSQSKGAFCSSRICQKSLWICSQHCARTLLITQGYVVNQFAYPEAPVIFHGCPFSSFLFNFVITQMLEAASSDLLNVGETFCDLAYADDFTYLLECTQYDHQTEPQKLWLHSARFLYLQNVVLLNGWKSAISELITDTTSSVWRDMIEH